MQAAEAGSGERTAAYRVVEGLHLRQWLARSAAPLAVLCTNGAGVLEVAWLPRHDAAAAWCGLPPSATTALRVVGLALVAVAAVLRVQAKGVLVRRTTLTTHGAYARVRHPFYLAAVLGGAGTLLLAGSLGAVVAVAWVALAVPVYAVTIAGEEDGLRTLYPEAWARYAATVPALLPRLARAARDGDAAGERSTWANLVREREPPRLLRFLAGAAAVGACALADRTPALAFGGLALLLLVASYLVPLVARPPRDGSPA